MTGLPTLTVELDDGTGTFPHDVTAYVHMPTGISATHGRQDEFSQVEAARLSLRLDNVDGRFTIGAPTYGIHVDQRIRFTETVGATVSKRFTGYVQDWPLVWPSPTASMATVTVSAFDRYTRLARRQLRSLVENEILLDGPLAYYTLGEPEGSTSAGDTSGNGTRVLVATGSGTAVAFGTATSTADDALTAATFAGGKYLSVSPGGTFIGGLECFFRRNGAPSTAETVIAFNNGAAEAVIETNGRLSLYALGGLIAQTAASVCDNTLRHVGITNTATVGALYLDGTLVGSGIHATVSTFSSLTLSVGGGGDSNGPAAFSGTIAHAAFYLTGPSAGRVTNHAEAGLSGFATQSSGDRVERLASYAGLIAADLDLESGALATPTQTTSGKSVLDALREVEQAEGGVLFVAGDGRLTFHNRTHRVLTSTGTAALAVTAADVDHDDFTISTDKTYLQNTVTGSRAGGPAQTVVSEASVDTFDEYPADLDLLVATDDEVLARINWQMNAYDEVAPRLSSVTLDLLTCSTAIQEAVLGLEIGDRLTVSGLPTQSPMATADLIVEGWSERASSGAWSITFNTAPAELFRAWILGDPVYGVLGSTTRLHY